MSTRGSSERSTLGGTGHDGTIPTQREKNTVHSTVDASVLEDMVAQAVQAATSALRSRLEGLSANPEQSKTVFSGSLADMTVADLIQTVHISRKSGVVRVSSGRRRGCIWVERGRAVDAEIGALRGSAAAYRILSIERGSFAVDIEPVVRDMTIVEDTPILLMEGLRLSDEAKRALNEGAGAKALLEVDEEVAARMPVGLMPAARSLLQVFRRRCSLEEALDWVELGAAEAAQHTATMLQAGILVPSTESVEAVEAGRSITVPLPPPEATATERSGDFSSSLVEVSDELIRPAQEKRRGSSAMVVGGTLGVLAACVVAGGAYLTQGSKTGTDAGADVPVKAEAAPAVVAAPPPSPCPEGMVLVEGGTFFMGSQSEHPALSMARPSHKVTLDSYCIAVDEVTVQHYRMCSDAGQCERAHRTSFWPRGSADKRDWERQRAVLSSLCNEGYDDRGQHPMNCVTWNQAEAYCRWKGWKLPTEAQWEFAVRGRDGRVYPWGDEPPGPTRTNGCGRECVDWRVRSELSSHPVMYEANDGFVGTAPIGSFPAGRTQLGLNDAVGNVFEWTADRFYAFDESPRINPTGPDEGNERIIRGGAFNSFMPEFAEPALRFPMDEDAHSHGIGFRCAAAPVDSKER